MPSSLAMPAGNNWQVEGDEYGNPGEEGPVQDNEDEDEDDGCESPLEPMVSQNRKRRFYHDYPSSHPMRKKVRKHVLQWKRNWQCNIIRAIRDHVRSEVQRQPSLLQWDQDTALTHFHTGSSTSRQSVMVLGSLQLSPYLTLDDPDQRASITDHKFSQVFCHSFRTLSLEETYNEVGIEDIPVKPSRGDSGSVGRNKKVKKSLPGLSQMHQYFKSWDPLQSTRIASILMWKLYIYIHEWQAYRDAFWKELGFIICHSLLEGEVSVVVFGPPEQAACSKDEKVTNHKPRTEIWQTFLNVLHTYHSWIGSRQDDAVPAQPLISHWKRICPDGKDVATVGEGSKIASSTVLAARAEASTRPRGQHTQRYHSHTSRKHRLVKTIAHTWGHFSFRLHSQ
ncbi:hypothetical protein BZA05DRAFT_433801 [Tricharina praecox]|uniref:uncharacterized protein n=1 Tax=Tricharina praecox TaxID=43433 RepID=UPI00222056F8|nr:uncharacterized protein BZA05DRAFT_433801 [Tricharina praecox]KAI5857181.1 hypothetical protein BZA05DRAFT_433801 [Tricharina praecox]